MVNRLRIGPVSARSVVAVLMVIAALMLVKTNLLWAGDSDAGSHSSLISSVGIAIIAATFMAFIGHVFKQPLLLAYIAAGIIIGPGIGFGLIENINDIETISHFGLILLLFLIGLEIDIKKLKDSGKSLIISGFSQFPINAAIGIGFFLILGYTFNDSSYDTLYLAACLSLSSTAIVVKLLYGKFELDTLAGRITLGVLIFQDLWAIVLLGIQPNLTNPNLLYILASFGKGFLLVVFSLLISKYLLPRIFKTIAKVPELILVSSLGWCFLICGLASYLKLSLEMGALIAGISISTFPYNLDVIAKVVNIRDFFVTLFFVSLGMQIPDPLADPSILATAAIVSAFLIGSRLLSVFPILYGLKNGLRVSLLTSINLAQISEFSLVIASLGVAAGHIGRDTLTVIIFVFVFTSVLSTYLIKYNDSIQKALATLLKRIGLKDIGAGQSQAATTGDKQIALLGFYRIASSLLYEIVNQPADPQGVALKDKLVVVDFNPEIHRSLNAMGIKVIYGDIGHLDTLHHAGIHDVKIVISTIPDTILVGTDNLKIIKHMKEICPHAKIIVTAESIPRALKMYAEGAHYVFLPRVLAANNLFEMVNQMLCDEGNQISATISAEIERLKLREEVIR